VGVVTARIPFALLGVVLLVGSTTFAATLHSPPATEPDVERAMDRASAETQSALRSATRTAAREAAREPVLVPAETPYGRAINSSKPFRDSLRVRLYLSARETLGTISRGRGDVRVKASLPAVETPADLRAGKRRVSIERAGPDGTALRVRIDGIRLTATRNGRVVGSRTRSPTLVVPSPTLAVHDRVVRYEQRLNAGPLEPGLGRRLTARLYPIVWARGYAQYGGAPIQNVLANRHVSLMTNGGILSLQRDVFGHSDPVGRDVLGRAVAHAALKGLLAGTEFTGRAYLEEAHGAVGLTPRPEDVLNAATVEPTVQPNRTVTVGVDGTAERVFVDSLDVLGETLREAYSARVRLRQRVRHVETRQVREPRDPGPEWGVVDTETRTSVRVQNGDPGPPHATPGTGHHVIGVHGRTVVQRHTTIYTWIGPLGRKTISTGQTVEEYAVTLTLSGSHTRGRAPVRPIASVHDPGGPFGGPNLADVPARARERLVESRGGFDRLAARAVTGGNVGSSAVVYGDRPDGLTDWVYTDLAALRERARNVSMETTHGDIATFRSNPPAVLAAKLRDRRAELVAAPERYAHVPERARVAARAEYVDRLIAEFETRAANRTDNTARLREKLSQSGRSGDPIERLQAAYDRRHERAESDPLSGIRMRVDAEPAYLTRTSLDHDTVQPIAPGAAEHPLVARNWNVLSLPYGDAVDSILGVLLGRPGTTRLRTGAQTLRTAERTDDAHDVDTARLEREVRRGTGVGLSAARKTLASFDLGDRASRRAVVAAAVEPWQTPGTRALAVSNGSAAAAIHAAAVERWSGELDAPDRDRLAVRLRQNVERATARRDARPSEPAVNGSARALRSHLQDKIGSELKETVRETTRVTLEDRLGRSLGRLPAGMPVAPVPGFWYATVNLWRVGVAGEYARFTVRVPRGTPDQPGAQLHYVRELGWVEIDVDGDGSTERLGRTTRVTFRTGTDVAIAVPPGPQGVGDVDGDTVEESTGWPEPGP